MLFTGDSEFVLRCDLYKNTTWVKNIVTREPVSTPSSALLSIRNILGEFDLPGFVERVSLTVSGFSNEHGTQSRIFSDHGDSNNEYFDQLINVDKSLEMLKKADSLRQNDPYIIDSLGWAHYLNKNYIQL